MAFESDKTMFEIYREKDFNKKFRLIIYTELNEHNKHTEINRALDGETIYDGFLKDLTKNDGKKILAEIVKEMNENNKAYTKEEIDVRLEKFLV
ncbi:MAG TPA: hypothetical protein PLG90_09995 [Ignavibacteria bacterium]|nr:hypothetical protein [Ignavibacteria bacterium]